jgi:hypothetical protein
VLGQPPAMLADARGPTCDVHQCQVRAMHAKEQRCPQEVDCHIAGINSQGYALGLEA